jgi:hypothetical protein
VTERPAAAIDDRAPPPPEDGGACTIDVAPLGDKALIEFRSEVAGADGAPLWQERLVVTAKDLAKLVARGQQVLARIR